MPATSRAALFAIVLTMCGFTACKKEKTVPTVDETKLFKIYNNSGATLNLKIYRSSFDYKDDKNPAINVRFDNNQFIYLEPAEFDASKGYFIDYYNDNLAINTWGIGNDYGENTNISIRIAPNKSYTISRRACNARSILLKDNKPSLWKAVDAFSGYTGERIWDTLSANKKNYQLECKRHEIKLAHIKAPKDTVSWIYDPLVHSYFDQRQGSTIFHGELAEMGNNPHVLIYNYSKPYLDDPRIFDFPGAVGTKDTIMIQVPYYMNFYMMVRQQ